MKPDLLYSPSSSLITNKSCLEKKQIQSNSIYLPDKKNNISPPFDEKENLDSLSSNKTNIYNDDGSIKSNNQNLLKSSKDSISERSSSKLLNRIKQQRRLSLLLNSRIKNNSMDTSQQNNTPITRHKKISSGFKVSFFFCFTFFFCNNSLWFF